MSDPIPSPAPVWEDTMAPPPPLAPGQLAPTWRIVFIAGWVGVIAAFAAVWQACRLAGLPPWWLGAPTNTRSPLIIALPFIGPVVAGVAGFVNLRWACHIGIAAAIGVAAVAVGDLDEHVGIGLVELAIAGSGLLVSVGCLGGRMRRLADAAPSSA